MVSERSDSHAGLVRWKWFGQGIALLRSANGLQGATRSSNGYRFADSRKSRAAFKVPGGVVVNPSHGQAAADDLFKGHWHRVAREDCAHQNDHTTDAHQGKERLERDIDSMPWSRFQADRGEGFGPRESAQARVVRPSMPAPKTSRFRPVRGSGTRKIAVPGGEQAMPGQAAGQFPTRAQRFVPGLDLPPALLRQGTPASFKPRRIRRAGRSPGAGGFQTPPERTNRWWPSPVRWVPVPAPARAGARS